MEVLMRSQGLLLKSGTSYRSADLNQFLAASSTLSSFEAPVSAHLRRTEQSARGIVRSKQVSAQFRPPVVFRETTVVAGAAPGASSGDVEGSSANGEEQSDGVDRGEWDVSSNCVTPVFRVSPLASPDTDGSKANKVHILFLSEGNVCRSVYAEAIFNALLRQHDLQDLVSCLSKATRDYNVGESADPRAVLVAEEHGLELPEGKVATVFDCSNDIVHSDLLLVMDKFTASDALKEVTVYEIINKQGLYSNKVRRLGEFCQTQQIEDIEDPLYGNMGGTEELESVRQIYGQIHDSCQGLIEYIVDVQANLQESESFKDGIARALGRMDALNWLAPPMLSKV